MIKSMIFPKGKEVTNEMKKVLNVFIDNDNKISSVDDKNKLHSNEVLDLLSDDLMKSGFQVETNKKHTITLNVKIEFGTGEKFFQPDAFDATSKTALEVEAGMAVANHRFLKDFFEAIVCDVDHLIIAVRQEYKAGKKKYPAHDYDKVVKYFESWFSSSRLVPFGLKSVLVIGY